MLCIVHYNTFHILTDSLLGVRQSLVAAKISSMPTTNELCNSLYSALKASVDKATNQLKVSSVIT